MNIVFTGALEFSSKALENLTNLNANIVGVPAKKLRIIE